MIFDLIFTPRRRRLTPGIKYWSSGICSFSAGITYWQLREAGVLKADTAVCVYRVRDERRQQVAQHVHDT